MVTRERLQCSTLPFFPHVPVIAQPDHTRRDSTALGIIRTLSRIDLIFVNLSVAKARDFHCYSHVFENLENRTIPSDHAAVRLVIQKPTNRVQQGKRIPSWMSQTSRLLLLSETVFMMTTDTLPIHLAHLRSSKLFLKRPKSRQFVNSHGRHLIAWEQSSLSPLLHYVPTEIDILDACAML